MLLLTNATVSTTAFNRATNTTTPKLTNVAVMISRPSAKTISQYSGLGIVRYTILFDPGSDVAAGDGLTIQSWGQHTVNPQQLYRVFDAPDAGGLGLEVIECVVGEAVPR